MIGAGYDRQFFGFGGRRGHGFELREGRKLVVLSTKEELGNRCGAEKGVGIGSDLDLCGKAKGGDRADAGAGWD